MKRKSYRVKFPGGAGFDLAGIVDRPEGIDVMPVAVFSHCFTCNKDLKAIVRISRALAEQGVAVLRYDMTGLGGSDGDFADTHFSTNMADLRAAIRFASGELAAVTALIGHSFGGAVSLAVAGSDHPDNLGAVVTLAAPSDTQHLAALLSRMNPAIERDASGSVDIGGRRWTIREKMLADFRHHDLPGMISRIAAPTLIMHSPVDKTVGYDHALRIMGLIQSGRDQGTAVSLVSIAGADHLLADSAADLAFVADSAAAFMRRYSLPS